MSCKKYSNRIGDLIENKLDAQSAERVTRHLIACQSCEAEFENRFYQKDLYSDLLFGIEPPNNLPAKFQAKLETEENDVSAVGKFSFGISERLSASFAFLQLNRALTITCALILVAFGFGFVYLLEDQEFTANNQPQIISESPRAILPKPGSFETENKDSGFADSGIVTVTAIRTGRIKARHLKKEFARLEKKTGKKVVAKTESAPENTGLIAEEQNQVAQVELLETDAARQIEKVEILFRAFRNARSTEGNGQFDVDYEKQQARKLLRNNAQLKQRAENYGTLLTEETLRKIEPYLLDIANLDGNPSAEKVSEIKDRFKSRNIIADLQGF